MLTVSGKPGQGEVGLNRIEPTLHPTREAGLFNLVPLVLLGLTVPLAVACVVSSLSGPDQVTIGSTATFTMTYSDNSSTVHSGRGCIVVQVPVGWTAVSATYRGIVGLRKVDGSATVSMTDPGYFSLPPLPDGYQRFFFWSEEFSPPYSPAEVAVEITFVVGGSAGPRIVSVHGAGTAGGSVGCQNPPLTLDVNVVEPVQQGTDTPAIHVESERQWYLKNSNGPGAADLVFPYGDPSDQAVKGDWDGDGDDTVGIYREGVFFLKNTNAPGNADLVIGFGVPGDIPVTGDWDGDGVDTIGVYRPSEAAWFLRNTNAAGAPDLSFTFGLANETPVTGDWDGDGIDTVGIFRASDRQWYLHNSNAGGNAELVFPYGDPAQDVPVVGDWDGDGDDTVGIYRAALGEWFLKNTNEAGFADLNFVYGLVNEKPLAGDWDGQ